jgi:hypothetical protein
MRIGIAGRRAPEHKTVAAIERDANKNNTKTLSKNVKNSKK